MPLADFAPLASKHSLREHITREFKSAEALHTPPLPPPPSRTHMPSLYPPVLHQLTTRLRDCSTKLMRPCQPQASWRQECSHQPGCRPAF